MRAILKYICFFVVWINNMGIFSVEKKQTMESPSKQSKKIETQGDYLQLFCDKFGSKSEDQEFQNKLAAMEKKFQDTLMAQPPIDFAQKKETAMCKFIATLEGYCYQFHSKESNLFSNIKFLDYEFYKEITTFDQHYQVIYKNALRAEEYSIDCLGLLSKSFHELWEKQQNIEGGFECLFKDFNSLVNEAHQQHKKKLDISHSASLEESDSNENKKTLGGSHSTSLEESDANEKQKTLDGSHSTSLEESDANEKQKTLDGSHSSSIQESDSNENKKTLDGSPSASLEESDSNENQMNKIFFCLISKLLRLSILSSLKKFEPIQDCYKEYIPEVMKNKYEFEKFFHRFSDGEGVFIHIQDSFITTAYLKQLKNKINTFCQLPYYNDWIQKKENFMKFFAFQYFISMHFSFKIQFIDNILHLHHGILNYCNLESSSKTIPQNEYFVNITSYFRNNINNVKKKIDILNSKIAEHSNNDSLKEINFKNINILKSLPTFLENCTNYKLCVSAVYNLILHKKLFYRVNPDGQMININQKLLPMDSAKRQPSNPMKALSITLYPLIMPKKEDLNLKSDQMDIAQIGHQFTALLRTFFNHLNNGGFANITSPLDIHGLCKTESEIQKLQHILFTITKNIRKNFTELDVDHCSYNTEKYVLHGYNDSKYFDPIWDVFVTTMEPKTQKLYQEFKEIIIDNPYGLLLKKINTKIRLILEIMDIKEVAKQDLLTKFITKMESLNKNPEGLKTIKEKLKYNGYPGQITLYFQTQDEHLESMVVSSENKRLFINDAFKKADCFLNEFFESWTKAKPHINPEIIFYGKTQIFNTKELASKATQQDAREIHEQLEEEKTPPKDVKFSKKQLKQLDASIRKEYKKQSKTTAKSPNHCPQQEENPLVHQSQTDIAEATDEFKDIMNEKISLYKSYNSLLQSVKNNMETCGSFLGIKNINVKTLIKQLDSLKQNPEPLESIKDEINDTQKYGLDSLPIELESSYNLNKINKLIREEKLKIDKFHNIIKLLSGANNYLYEFIANWAQENHDDQPTIINFQNKSLYSRPKEKQDFYRSDYIPQTKGKPGQEGPTARKKKQKKKQEEVKIIFQDAIDQEKERKEAAEELRKSGAAIIKQELARQAQAQAMEAIQPQNQSSLQK